MYWYLKVIKSSFDFKGRARRKEFWYFVLFNFIIGITTIFIDEYLGLTKGDLSINRPFFSIYTFIMILPALTVSIRRLHDVGKSGWNLLWNAIPIFGGIFLLIAFVYDGEKGANKYGTNPKSETIL